MYAPYLAFGVESMASLWGGGTHGAPEEFKRCLLQNYVFVLIAQTRHVLE